MEPRQSCQKPEPGGCVSACASMSVIGRQNRCRNKPGHLFPISVGKQDIRCCICELRIHLVSRPSEMWRWDNVAAAAGLNG